MINNVGESGDTADAVDAVVAMVTVVLGKAVLYAAYVYCRDITMTSIIIQQS